MKKYAFLLLLVFTFSCSSDDGPQIPDGDSITTVNILGWKNIGTLCNPEDVSGDADFEITFNGPVPKTGQLLLQSRWKLPTDTNWTLESPNPKFLKDLNRNGNKVTVEDGFCWDSDISIISYQLTYESASGDESATVTIDIPRPE